MRLKRSFRISQGACSLYGKEMGWMKSSYCEHFLSSLRNNKWLRGNQRSMNPKEPVWTGSPIQHVDSSRRSPLATKEVRLMATHAILYSSYRQDSKGWGDSRRRYGGGGCEDGIAAAITQVPSLRLYHDRVSVHQWREISGNSAGAGNKCSDRSVKAGVFLREASSALFS
jgi:hypothetical protein